MILAGVHDIKNFKLAICDEDDARFNSPDYLDIQKEDKCYVLTFGFGKEQKS